MSDYEYRNKSYNHMPPTRSAGAGGLLFVLGLIVLFVLAMFFFGSGSGGGENTAPVATDGAPAATDTVPAPAVPEPAPALDQ